MHEGMEVKECSSGASKLTRWWSSKREAESDRLDSRPKF